MDRALEERYRTLATEQLAHTLKGIDIPELGTRIPGKVRDSYVRGVTRFLVTSDRLSAFDVILTTIPFKGQLLNEIARYWFDATSDIAANHIIDYPHPNVFVAQQVTIIPVEVVVRGYLAGSAWRDYQAGKAISGITLPPGMKEFQQLDTPIITPSTKAPAGTHDEPISSEELVKAGKVEAKVWSEVCEKALALFRRGTELAAKRGLILVDTKYEFGLSDSGKVILADEIHTQDSSRYWTLATYNSRVESGEAPEMLDKEFVRRWLIDRGYMGNGPVPNIPDSFRVDTALRYIDNLSRITGREFQPLNGPQEQNIRTELLKVAGSESR